MLPNSLTLMLLTGAIDAHFDLGHSSLYMTLRFDSNPACDPVWHLLTALARFAQCTGAPRCGSTSAPIATILTAGAIKLAAMLNLGCVNAETVCKCRNFENKST